MSHDELETLDVLDEEEFLEDSVSDSVEEPTKVVVSKKARRGTRRRIDDVLEEQRLKAALKAYEDSLTLQDGFFDHSPLD